MALISAPGIFALTRRLGEGIPRSSPMGLWTGRCCRVINITDIIRVAGTWRRPRLSKIVFSIGYLGISGLIVARTLQGDRVTTIRLKVPKAAARGRFPGLLRGLVIHRSNMGQSDQRENLNPAVSYARLQVGFLDVIFCGSKTWSPFSDTHHWGGGLTIDTQVDCEFGQGIFSASLNLPIRYAVCGMLRSDLDSESSGCHQLRDPAY